MDIKKLVRPNIRSLKAYKTKEIPCRVKLDANESPYSAVSSQRSAISVKNIFNALNRYPDPEALELRKLVARGWKVKYGNTLHGNGSDELIYYLIIAFGGPVLYPVPTFSMYGIIAQALNTKKIEVPLDKDFDLDLGKMLKVIRKDKPKLIFLASPNNPTGNAFSVDKIEKIIRASKGLVVVDEAYQDYSAKKSFLTLFKKYNNLVTLRTLSKIGLAGLRTGFIIADTEVIEEVNKVRLPFNLNSLSQKVAIETLQKKKGMSSSIRSIISERKRLFKKMQKIGGIDPDPSDANFILFKVDNSDNIYKGLLRKQVLIRDMSGTIKNCLRVTVGTPAENSSFLKALKQLLIL
ncbi:MAG TPA: histidinol-phosphate transaminase [Nitrospirae bacterium]|nr:histidinol-phosphate transaminase [Nitrospirota bacterium]